MAPSADNQIEPGMELVDALPWVLITACLSLFVCIFLRLRTRHKDIYEQLGSPLTGVNDDKHERQVVKFLFSSQWRQLNDPTLGVMLIVVRTLVFLGAASVVLKLARNLLRD